MDVPAQPAPEPQHARLRAVHEAARTLREQAQRAAGGIAVLAWCPRLAPGGGARLILSLLPALAHAPQIAAVRLAVPAGILDTEAKARLRAAGVAIVELAPQVRAGVERAALLCHDGRVLAIRARREWYDETVAELAARCDLVYVFWPHMMPPPRIATPIVATIQDTTLIDYLEGAPQEWWREGEATGEWMRRAAEVVVSSLSTQRNLIRLFGENGARAHVIHHAILPAASELDSKLPDEVTVALPDRYVIFAGNITPHKNLDLLLRAWARFAHRREWPLLAIGYGTAALAGLTPLRPAGWREAQLAGLAARLGLDRENGLHTLGFVPDGWVRPLIAGAAALVMPSFTEGGGSFPVEEAMRLGTPVLCADIPVMREHLQHASAQVGWFDPESLDSLLRALCALVADHDARRASAIAGRDDPRPSWDDVARQYAELFVQVTARTPAAPA